jgi:hypothetical protein
MPDKSSRDAGHVRLPVWYAAREKRRRELQALIRQYGLTQAEIAQLTESGVTAAESWTCDSPRRASMMPDGLFELLKLRLSIGLLAKIRDGMTGDEEDRLLEEARRRMR